MPAKLKAIESGDLTLKVGTPSLVYVELYVGMSQTVGMPSSVSATVLLEPEQVDQLIEQLQIAKDTVLEGRRSEWSGIGGY